jgi:hypothetical protein
LTTLRSYHFSPKPKPIAPPAVAPTTRAHTCRQRQAATLRIAVCHHTRRQRQAPPPQMAVCHHTHRRPTRSRSRTALRRQR